PQVRGCRARRNTRRDRTEASGDQAGIAEMERIDIAEKFARVSEQWQPKIVAELNGQEVKLVKVQGTFPWHRHDDVEEMFLVWRGRFRVEFRDRIVELGPGELVVVPRGVEARSAAED